MSRGWLWAIFLKSWALHFLFKKERKTESPDPEWKESFFAAFSEIFLVVEEPFFYTELFFWLWFVSLSLCPGRWNCKIWYLNELFEEFERRIFKEAKIEKKQI